MTVTVNTNVLLMLTRVLTERSFILAAAASHLLPTRARTQRVSRAPRRGWICIKLMEFFSLLCPWKRDLQKEIE